MRDGRILGIDDEFFHDQGGYVRTHAATVPDLAAAMLPGPYRVPAYRAAGHVRLTNKTPGGTYRAPGRYESTFVRERLMDAIAQRLGLDRVEVRRRNLIAKERDAVSRGRSRRSAPTSCSIPATMRGLLDKALAARQVGRAAGETCAGAAPPANASAPGLRSSSRRAGSGRSTACASSVDSARPCRGRDRRGLGRAGRRDRGGADLRRRARRRLRARARGARPAPTASRSGRARSRRA